MKYMAISEIGLKTPPLIYFSVESPDKKSCTSDRLAANIISVFFPQTSIGSHNKGPVLYLLGLSITRRLYLHTCSGLKGSAPGSLQVFGSPSISFRLSGHQYVNS